MHENNEQEVDNMTYSKRYGKPNMTNLPSELGKGIFEQILSTPRPDDDKLEAEARELEKQMIKVREREDAQGYTAQ